MKKSLVVVLALIALSLPLAAQVPEFAGPPQFLTFPILLHVSDSALDHGHFVFGGEAALPAPLAPDRGASTAGPAVGGGTALLSTANADIDVSKTPDAYEGETGASSAAASGGLLVAGSNHIY